MDNETDKKAIVVKDNATITITGGSCTGSGSGSVTVGKIIIREGSYTQEELAKKDLKELNHE